VRYGLEETGPEMLAEVLDAFLASDAIRARRA
jgi:hypothetical protein